MKKIRLISLFIIICLLLASCAGTSDAQPETEETQERKRIHYSVLVQNHNSEFANTEYEIKDTEFFTADPSESVEITLLGKTYSGSYQSTSYLPNAYYPTHFYTGATDPISFTVDHRGYVTSFNAPFTTDIDQSLPVLSHDDAISMAISFVEEEIMVKEEDFTTDDYNVALEVLSDISSPDVSIYRINFFKYLDDFVTMDHASVCMTDRGEIYQFSSEYFDMIDTNAEVEYDAEQVTLSIEEKLDSIFKNEEDISDVKYGLSDDEMFMKITRLKNGTLALTCSVTVSYKTNDIPSNSQIVESITLIIQ